MKKFKRVLLLSLMGLAWPVFAQGVSEYTVKAAYLYNFAQFVDWPKGAFGGDAAPLVIGIVGDDPFGSSIDDAISGKSAGGHPLSVKRLGAFDPAKASALGHCQMLFISYSEKDHLRDILQALEGAKTLTVSEIDRFPMKGGMIQFDQVGEKITLDVNPTAAKHAGLSLRAQLLQVSKIQDSEE
jgi:hypothetical protein